MTSKECAFCGIQLELGNDEDDIYLWVRPGMTFDEGELACPGCVNGVPGALQDSLHGA
jgi:hypothetical protein